MAEKERIIIIIMSIYLVGFNDFESDINIYRYFKNTESPECQKS